MKLDELKQSMAKRNRTRQMTRNETKQGNETEQSETARTGQQRS
jgi:hypothetical protein